MKYLISLLTLTLLLSGCFTSSVGRSKRIQGEVGLNIPEWGVAIDAIYDKQLDDLIPGYKLLNVVLTNRSQEGTIYLDPKKDKWVIRDNVGKVHRAINHLRFINNDLWTRLPVELKNRLEYPNGVRSGKTTKIDLFFPVSVELNNYRELTWRSSHFKKKFVIINTVEKNLDIIKEESIPPRNTQSYRQSLEKYEVEEIKKRNRENNQTNPSNNSDNSSVDKSAPQFDPNLDDFSITME